MRKTFSFGCFFYRFNLSFANKLTVWSGQWNWMALCVCVLRRWKIDVDNWFKWIWVVELFHSFTMVKHMLWVCVCYEFVCAKWPLSQIHHVFELECLLSVVHKSVIIFGSTRMACTHSVHYAYVSEWAVVRANVEHKAAIGFELSSVFGWHSCCSLCKSTQYAMACLVDWSVGSCCELMPLPLKQYPFNLRVGGHLSN